MSDLERSRLLCNGRLPWDYDDEDDRGAFRPERVSSRGCNSRME